MSYGPIDYGRLAEKLKEEVTWRLGIRWWAGHAHHSVREEERRPSAFVYHASFVTEADGCILIGDRYQVLCVTRDYRILWKVGNIVPPSIFQHVAVVDYNWETGRVLISDIGAKKMYEYDPKTGRFTLELSGVNGVAFQEPRATYQFRHERFYRPYREYTGNLVIADYKLGKVWIVDREGRVLNELSVSHPYTPFADEVLVKIPRRDAHVCWEWNLETGESYAIQVWPHPTGRDESGGLMALSSDYFFPVVWHHDGMLGVLPNVSEYCCQITTEMTALMTAHGAVLEIDLRSPFAFRARSAVYPNVNGTLAANASTAIYPVPAIGMRSIVVHAWSSQSATLEIYRLRAGGKSMEQVHAPAVDANGNPIWDLYDSIPVDANRLATYIITSPAGIYGVRLVMGGSSGDYHLWALYEPAW